MTMTMRPTMITVSTVLLGLSVSFGRADTLTGRAGNSTPTVVVDPKAFAVLPDDFAYRTDGFNQRFNPTNAQEFPIFQIFNDAFRDIIGSSPSISEIASNSSFAFANEAPVYIADTDEVFFASSAGPQGMNDIDHNNGIFKLSLSEAEKMLRSGGNQAVNVPITQIPLPDSVQMTSGGTGPINGNIILSNAGRGSRPPSLVMFNAKPPYSATTLLNNFYGRQFNSLNDVKVHPTSGKLFFSDTIYGFLLQFRSQPPLIPSQIYSFDMKTGVVRVAADGFDKPNGIAFTPDGKTAYIGDGGSAGGNAIEPSTIYAFDVDPTTQALLNRRVLAYIDSGIPDGIELDTKGNIYTACSDGVQVFNPEGTLLGKFFINTISANMIFAGPGRLVILAGTKVFLAKIAPSTKGVIS